MIIERRRFAVWDIAFVHAPIAIRQHVELYEAVDGLLLFRVERGNGPQLVHRHLALREKG